LTSAAHLLVGGAAGSLCGSPLVAFGAGAASHVLLDLVPHFDHRDFRVDVALTAATGLLLVGAAAARGTLDASLLAGMAGGVVPDVENLLWHMGYLRKDLRVFPTHREGWLKHGAPRGPGNLVVQALLGLAAVLVVFR
jgi:hypothetical protein